MVIKLSYPLLGIYGNNSYIYTVAYIMQILLDYNVVSWVDGGTAGMATTRADIRRRAILLYKSLDRFLTRYYLYPYQTGIYQYIKLIKHDTSNI